MFKEPEIEISIFVIGLICAVLAGCGFRILALLVLVVGIPLYLFWIKRPLK